MKTTTSTLKIGCSNAPVAERNACARTLPAPLQLAIEADHKVGFGYSLDAEFAGHGCDAIGRGRLPSHGPHAPSISKGNAVVSMSDPHSGERQRLVSGVATRVVGDRWGSRPMSCRPPNISSNGR